MPPLANHYGKLYSVAELIAYRYATLLSNGDSMSPSFDIAYYTNSAPCKYIAFHSRDFSKFYIFII